MLRGFWCGLVRRWCGAARRGGGGGGGAPRPGPAAARSILAGSSGVLVVVVWLLVSPTPFVARLYSHVVVVAQAKDFYSVNHSEV